MSLDSLCIYNAILETVSFKIGFRFWKEVPLYSNSGALPPIDFLHWNSIKFNWITMGESTRCQLLALRLRNSLSSGIHTYQCWVQGKGFQRAGLYQWTPVCSDKKQNNYCSEITFNFRNWRKTHYISILAHRMQLTSLKCQAYRHRFI